jgi:hypothetical protein
LFALTGLSFGDYLDYFVAAFLFGYMFWRICVDHEHWKDALELWGLGAVLALWGNFAARHSSQLALVVQIGLLMLFFRSAIRYRKRTAVQRKLIVAERERRRKERMPMRNKTR